MLPRIEPKLYDLNGQTVFLQYDGAGNMLTTAVIFVEVTVEGARLGKAIEFPMMGTLADWLKAGWNFGRTVPPK